MLSPHGIRILALLSLLVLIIACSTILLQADESDSADSIGYGNNLRYTISGGELKITGSGDMVSPLIYYSTNMGNPPWWDKRNSITSIVIGEGVTSVAEYVFSDHSNVINVTLPSTLKSIGDNAFLRCNSIQKINIPASVQSIRALENAFPSYTFYEDKNHTIELDKTPENLRGFTWAGSGNCKLHKYFTYKITFITYSGKTVKEVEKDTMPSFTGDTSKPSTEQYEYKFTGWNPKIVKATEDATYEAVYEESVRKYTVTFKNTSGKTLFQKPVEYQTVPEFDYSELPGYVDGDYVELDRPLEKELQDQTYIVTWYSKNGNPWGLTYDATWIFDSDSRTLAIFGDGVMSSDSQSTTYQDKNGSYTSDPPWKQYLKDVKKLFIGPGIKSIGYYAFKGATQLTELDIRITGEYFLGYGAFEDCSSLTSISLPGRCTTMPGGGFILNGCSSLKEIKVYDWLQNHLGIDNICVDGNVLYSGNKEILYTYPAAYNKTTFQATGSVVTIASGAFKDNRYLVSVQFDRSLEEIESEAFMNCTSLKEFNKPYSIRYLGQEAFSGCTSLEDVVLSDKLTEIPKGCFSGCTSLKSLYVPETIVKIGGDAFKGLTFMISGNAVEHTVKNLAGREWFGVGDGILYDASEYHWVRYNPAYDSSHSERYCIKGTVITVANCSETVSGQTFAGWSYNGVTYKPGDKITVGDSDITLTAVWDKIPRHSVQYLDEDSSISQSSVYEGQSFTIREALSNRYAGKVFAGWSYNGTTYSAGDSLIMGNSDIKFYAVWEDAPKHHVTYDVDGGSLSAPTQADVSEGLSFVLASYDGTKTGYTFAGWTIGTDTYRSGYSYTMRTADVLLIAIWVKDETHAVTYNVNGGSLSAPNQDDVKAGSSFIVSSYSGVKQGFAFSGWTNNNKTYQPGDVYYVYHSDVQLTAVWVPLHHVSYNVDGGSLSAPTQPDVAEGSSFTVASYSGTKTGYGFEGWICNDILYKPGRVLEMGESDMTFKASWIVKPLYHVTYNVNGGSSPAPTQVDLTEGASLTLAPYSGTRSGYAFGGWSYHGSTYQPGSTIKMPSENIIIEAIWMSDNEHLVQYVVDGGSEPAPIQEKVEQGAYFEVQSYSGIKEGMAFGGWLCDDKFYLPGTSLTMGDKDMAFTAYWYPTEVVVDLEDYSNEIPNIDRLVGFAKEDSRITLNLNLVKGSIELDNTALCSVRGSSLTASIEAVNDPIAELEGRDSVHNYRTFDVALGDNHDFGNGTVTVSLYVSLGQDWNDYQMSVYYVKDGKLMEKCQHSYDGQYLIFKTNHLSNYVVVLENENNDGSLNMYTIIIPILVVILIIAMILVAKRTIFKKSR